MLTKKYDNIKISRLLPVVFVLLCVLLPVITFAQGPPDPEDIPIDGGLSLLLAAGAAYGIKKCRNYSFRNRKSSQF